MKGGKTTVLEAIDSFPSRAMFRVASSRAWIRKCFGSEFVRLLIGVQLNL